MVAKRNVDGEWNAGDHTRSDRPTSSKSPPTGRAPVEFSFTGRLWEAEAEGPWVFVTLPVAHADDVREQVPRGPGFGSVKVSVSTGDTEWSTSIFPDKASGSYVLPVKREVRSREGLEPGDRASFTLRVVH